MNITADQNQLSIIAQADSTALKELVDTLLPNLGEIQVLRNRTGLMMLPYTDTVKGTVFHLGELLVAEALVTVSGVEGYGAVLGRDLEQALAVAIIDALSRCEGFTAEKEQISRFTVEQAEILAAAEETLLKQVEATRVEMDTF